MAPRLMLLTSSGSKKKEPRYLCLSAAKASHTQRMWAEVSSVTPHFLYNGLSSSPRRWRCLRRVLCPVRRPVTTLDWFLLKDRSLTLVLGQGPEISSRACLTVLPRSCHDFRCKYYQFLENEYCYNYFWIWEYCVQFLNWILFGCWKDMS